jgi:myo-inositol 2-dehydrogenase / D-chiro-inositol 1-dehydrogenase
VEPVRIGVIGCGRIVRRVHFDGLAATPGVEVVALADPDPEARAAGVARFPGARAFGDPSELVSWGGAEAVLVCVPSALHAAVAAGAFEAGLHVYVEKPVAADLEGARRVARAWRASGRVGMVGLNFRHDPRYRELRERLRRGEIGELVAARSVFCSAAQDLPAWKRSRAAGGGVLLDLASHHADLVRFLLGEVVQVSASLRSVRGEGDTAGLRMVLADGVVVESLFSSSAIDDDRFEVYGTEGRLAVDRYGSPELERGASPPAYGRGARLRRELASALRGLRRVARGAGEPSFRTALARFAAATRGTADPSPDLEDGLRSLQIVLAAEESARSGLSVALSTAAAGEPAA